MHGIRNENSWEGVEGKGLYRRALLPDDFADLGNTDNCIFGDRGARGGQRCSKERGTYRQI